MDVEYKPIGMKEIDTIVLYKRRYDRTAKDIYSSNYVSNQDQTYYDEIRKFVSVKKVADTYNEFNPATYNEYLDRVIDNKDNSSPFGDALTYVFLREKRNTSSMKEFFRKHFGYDFVVIETDEPEQNEEYNIVMQ